MITFVGGFSKTFGANHISATSNQDKKPLKVFENRFTKQGAEKVGIRHCEPVLAKRRPHSGFAGRGRGFTPFPRRTRGQAVAPASRG